MNKRTKIILGIIGAFVIIGVIITVVIVVVKKKIMTKIKERIQL